MRERLRRWKELLNPGERAWHTAGTSLWRFTILLLLIELAYDMATWRPNAATLIVYLGVVWALLLVGLLVAGLVCLLAKIPFRYGRIFTTCFVLLVLILGGPRPGGLLLALGVVVIASLLGAGVGGIQSSSQPRRAVALAGFLLGFAGLIAYVVWFIWSGPALKTPVNAATKSAYHAAALTLPDPGAPGSYAVKTLTYGGGTDRKREEYGAGATLKTQPVDGSKLVDTWKGRRGWARSLYWGFDAKQMPVQARVWYPDGAGPFPLVLIVHGNHSMEKFSDPGYEYLGRHLASRGFILASVDENFLNGSTSDVLGLPDFGLGKENDARGWMLLEHLKVWKQWNQTPGNPFHGKVDMENIALMGHSRGGEAVAVAAVLNRLSRYPENANLVFDYHFNLKGIVAIAPVDGQYKPAGESTKPENVNYFALHGDYDGDVQSFHASRVLERVKFTDNQEHFKTSLYIHGANHGQFNSTWGWADNGGLGNWLLNRRGIMPQADQQRIAKVAITAFLEASLRGQKGYLPLFRDWRAGRAWLPDTVYLQEYVDSATQWLANYDEDIDASTATVAGGSLRGENLSDWREKLVSIKWGDKDTRAVFLGWNNRESPGVPSYTLTLPESGVLASPESVLTFALADTKQSPKDYDNKKDKDKDKKKEEKKDDKKEPEPIDFTIEVADSTGAKASVPLSSYAYLQRQLESQVTKWKALNSAPGSEVVYQNFEFPLSAFRGVDPAKLRTIRFVFDRTDKAVIILDNLGLRK